MTRKGITTAATPIKKPPISRIRGVRLCSGIFTKRKFPTVCIATGSSKNNEDGGDANDANDSEGEVGRRERGPGGDGRHCRLVVYCVIILKMGDPKAPLVPV
jgi:hypothetical protein